MPSLGDVFNQLVTANTTLNQIHADMVAEQTATEQVNSNVEQLDTDLKSGFEATDNGLATLAQIDTQAVALLFHLTQQADTIICALENISQNTCGILNQVTIQTVLQTRIRDDADAQRDITEFAHPEATLQRHRLEALRDEIEKCCPPKPVPPACAYQPCPRPDPITEPPPSQKPPP